MQVLVCLARNAGEVVTREQFIETVWAGRYVGDEVLSRCISILRSHLGDDPKAPRYIKTVPRIGYLLLCPVVWETTASDAHADSAPTVRPAVADDTPPSWRSGKAPALVLAAAALLLVFGLRSLWQTERGEAPVAAPSPPRLVVLPFINMSDDPGNDYLSDGLTEDLIGRLATLPDLQVVGSASAFALKDRDVDPAEIARRLGVAHVLKGSVRRSDNRIRISAELSDADSGVVQWSQNFDTAFSDIFLIQDQISKSIVDALRPRLSNARVDQAATVAPTTVMAAYELWLRGRFHLRKRDEASILRSVRLFAQALELDDQFGDAYRDLARAYALLPTYSDGDPEVMFQRADETLSQGVGKDPTLNDRVYDVRAFLHYSRWQWIDAEEDFQRALALTPNDPNLYQWYSQQLAAVGKPALALEASLTARDLDRLSPVINHRLAVIYQWLDNDQMALEQYRLAEELGLDPSVNPEPYALLQIRLGHWQIVRDALAGIQSDYPQAERWVDAFVAALADPAKRPQAIIALQQAAADQQIDSKYLQGSLAALGDSDGAIAAAFVLLDEPTEFEIEFLFARENAGVRKHPRFAELVTRIGLDQYWQRYGWPPACRRNAGEIVCH